VELKGQTYITLLYAKEMELLRPKDFAVLPANNRYVRHTTEVTVNTNYYRAVSLKMDVRWGTRINYDAPTGQIPFLAGRTSVNTTLTVRPSRKLRVDNTYILFRLHDRMSGVGSMNNHIIRSKLNYQFTRALSFRFIGQYNSLLTNPTFTSLQTAKDFNADFLVTYLLRPSTAIYVGYNTNRENLLNPLAADIDGNLLRGPRYINDGRNFFVKASYLLRF
jgi:predicted porin